MLSHNRFIDYLVLIFVDKKKAQIYTFPNKVDEYDIIQYIIDFPYQRLFSSNKHLERYHIGTPKHENFLSKIGDKKYTSTNLFSRLQQIVTLINTVLSMVVTILKTLLHMTKQIFIICWIKNMNLLVNIKNLHSKTNILTYTEIIKQTVKNYKFINLFINKWKQLTMCYTF